jgi:hypothetical protein
MRAGRPRNINRDIADLSGDRFYEGSACWCGNTRRYTKGGRCVDCAIAQARTQSASKRKPKVKLATPAQRAIIGIGNHTRAASGIKFPTAAEIDATPMDPISQQIADLAAREEIKTAEEASRAEKIAAINRIETGGLTLCGIKVSEPEMAEYVRASIIPDRCKANLEKTDEH